MNSFSGYLKKKLGDSYMLLAGGGHKSINDFLIRICPNPTSESKFDLAVNHGNMKLIGLYNGNSNYTNNNGASINDRSVILHLSGKDGNTLHWNQINIDSGVLRFRSEDHLDWHTVCHSSNSSVSKSGETLTVKINNSSYSLTNTWRGIQNNLTSDSTTDSLSAALGKALANGSARDDTKLPLAGGTLTGNLTIKGLSLSKLATSADYDTVADGIWNSGVDTDTTSIANTPTNKSLILFKFTSYSGDSDIRSSYFVLDATGKAFIRGSRETNQPWKELLHSGNYTSYVYSKSTSDDRYVNITGDTMTGGLNFKFGHDLTQANNGVESAQYYGIRIYDKNNYLSAQFLNPVLNSGSTQINLNLRNRNGSTEYNKGFVMTLTKSGVLVASLGGAFTADSFKKSGGTSSQFLKADGSVDSNSYVVDSGGNYTEKIYSIGCKQVFSGYNLSDAPTTGWVSGIALGSNWNNSHYQHYLVEVGSRWYATRTYSNGSMTDWNTFAYLTDIKWSLLADKPSTFTPSSHTHPLSQITRGTAAEAYSDWNYIFLNTNGGSLKSVFYLTHGGGYGAHLRGYSTSASVYMLEIFNSNKQVFAVYGDGHSNFGGNLSIAGTTTSSGTITASGGYLVSTLNNNTITIGSANANFMHFLNSANIPFWFNRDVKVLGELYAGSEYNQKVWHAGNDGSGSGLDADTVDGFHVDNSGNGPTWGILTPIKSDGVLEVGKYIDFHNTSNDGKDYATRILVTLYSGNVINIPTASGTFALTSQIPTVNNASLTLQTAGTTQTTFYANDATNRTFNVTCANIGAAPAHDHPYVRTYSGTDVNPSSTYGYYAVMTTQSGITNDWWHILHMDWQGGANWRSELALPTQNRTGVYYRSDGNNWAWNSWIGLLDTSSTALTKSGNLTCANFYTTSDRAKKQNISSLSEHIRKFQLKDTEKWHYGVIAQEVPEMFRDGKEGSYTVNYNSVLSYYIGILENKVRLLEEKINKLEGNG